MPQIAVLHVLIVISDQAIGAVNTIVKRPSDGKLIGYNTDYVGAISAIEDGIRGTYTTKTNA